MKNEPALSRRERQILDAVYTSGTSSAEQIRAAIEDPPGNSAIRSLLRTLVEKGHLVTEREGKRYLYRPTVPREEARAGALGRVVDAFFGRSPLRAAMALVEMSEAPSATEVAELEALIAQARERQR